MTDQSKNLLAGFVLVLVAMTACLFMTAKVLPTLEPQPVEQEQR